MTCCWSTRPGCSTRTPPARCSTIADEAGARVAFVGDRHQLPAVGRGGVLDHAIAWAHPTAVVTLEKVHRFTDPDYAALSLRMRTGDDPASVFDALHRRGQIVIHASEVERTAALAEAGAAGDLVIADTREQVADLNAAIRDQRGWPARATAGRSRPPAASGSGSGTASPPAATTPTCRSPTARPGPSPASATTAASLLHGRGRDARSRPSTPPGSSSSPTPPPSTAPRARPSTAPTSRIGDTTGAAAAYVAMTRGRDDNTAHLVAETVDDARRAVGRDLQPRPRRPRTRPRTRQAIDAIDRYGPQPDAARLRCRHRASCHPDPRSRTQHVRATNGACACRCGSGHPSSISPAIQR